MNNEANRTRPRWYQLRWRWMPPGGYYGGFVGGFGLGIMTLALAAEEDWVRPTSNRVFALGAAIMLIGNYVCLYLEKRRGEKDR